MLVNTAHLVDVDARSGSLSGHLWSHVYSGDAQQLDIQAKVSPTDIQPSAGDGNVFLDWQGLPGRGLGGLQSQLQTDRGMPSYAIEHVRSGTRVSGVGIASAGTKAFRGDWTGRIEPTGQSALQQLPGVDQLQGEVVNPLPFDLYDSILFYHNWYYVLNSRIAPGERLAVSADTIPKTRSRRLNRQRTVDGNVNSTRWDPSDRAQLDRLLELMMFYKAASGKNYTSLEHRYQPHLDQSNLLDTDLAILVGRVDVPPVEVVVKKHVPADHDANATESKLGGATVGATVGEVVAQSGGSADRAWYRITIPVARPSGK
ncbi:MAG: hypothetical protein R3C53_13980 [Pirellulaceae bacterium]